MMNDAKTPSASTTMKTTRRKMDVDEDEECVPVVGLYGYLWFVVINPHGLYGRFVFTRGRGPTSAIRV